MKLLQACAFASAVVTVSTTANGYSFNDFVGSTPATEKTGLTTNEESRIIGGLDADIDSYPYVASVRIDGVTVCPATLIAPQYLLTTAHCIRTAEFKMVASFDSEFSFGTDGELVNIVKGYKHPMYNKRKHLHDVGLLKLEKPSKQKTAALPAVDGSDNKVGAVATVLGWGQTKESTQSFTLREVNIPIISNTECAKYDDYKNLLTEGMLCAGKKGKGSCRGDAGGPLIANDALVGFVSWAGGKCGKQPGVYTRVSYYLDYINDILNGGDGKSFAEGALASGSAVEEVTMPSSMSGSLETVQFPVTKSTKTPATEIATTKTTTVPVPTTATSSSGSAAAQKSSTKGLTFSFDGSTAAQKDGVTKAPATTDTTQQ
ncbi:hypothetical protein PRNP1_006982 [Phytophthora ramorum]